MIWWYKIIEVDLLFTYYLNYKNELFLKLKREFLANFLQFDECWSSHIPICSPKIWGRDQNLEILKGPTILRTSQIMRTIITIKLIYFIGIIFNLKIDSIFTANTPNLNPVVYMRRGLIFHKVVK